MAPTFWFAGAENPAHHPTFALHGISRVAVNIGSLSRNYSRKFTGLDLGPDTEWIAWTDSLATLDDLLEVISTIGVRPSYVVGPDEWSSHPLYLPSWNGEDALPASNAANRGLFITDKVFKDKKRLLNRALSARKANHVLGVITGRPNGLERFDIVINTSWYNPQSFGETHVWDGKELHRYPAPKKDEMRAHHVEHIQALGVDPDLVLEDDTDEVVALSLRSWLALEESLDRPMPAPTPGVDPADTDMIEAASLPALPAANVGPLAQAPASIPQAPRQLLPTIQALEEVHHDEHGNIVSRESVIQSTPDSVRSCSNCYLSAACPAYNPAASCAYSIPVQIRTKTQLSKVMQAVIEIQTQRVLQSRFSEEVQGQELEDRTGKEMERLFKMVESMKNVETTQDGFKVLIEGAGATGAQQAGGVLSKLFGSSVAAKAQGEPLDVVDADEVPDA